MSSQLRVLEDTFDGRSLIEASAGTGKTWTLAVLYARLLLEKRLSVGQVLVVTYTTAATAELRERIRARLAELLAVFEGEPSDDAILLELRARYPQEEHLRRLRLAVHGFDEAAIFTIHGFCQRALQEAAFEAGGDFDNELSHDDAELIDTLLSDLWRQELASADPAWASYLAKSGLTPKQLRQKLRSHLGKPYLRVEPRATTPKLDDLKPVWQQAQQVWQREGAEFCAALCDSGALNGNSYDATKIRSWQTQLDAYFIDFACLFDANDALKRLSSAELISKTKKGHTSPTAPVSDALQQLHDALEALRPQAEQRLIGLTVQLLERLAQQLPQRKREQRILAFDDLLNCLDQALADPASGQLLAEKLREQYPVALIDEFQDTDPIQYSIFRSIYRDGGDLCFVGDPKQAIYAFRGADLATYLTAKAEGERTYQLGVNHRSSAAVIKGLNTLFDFPGSMAASGLDYHKVDTAGSTRAPLRLPAQCKALNWVWLDAGDPEKGLSKGQAADLVARDCAVRIAELLALAEQGEVYFETSPQVQPLKGGDIAVLVASHRQAALVAAELAALGVPSVRRGKESVWASDEAAEFEAVLRAYAEPAREGLLRHALLTRLLGRSAADLLAYQSNPGEWDRQREASERYHQLWQQGFMRTFRLWLDEQQVAERLLQLADGERRLTNLLHLAELVQEESERRPGLEPLLAWYAAQRSSESHGDSALLRLESDAERVQIVTIHTSKGLEYPLVFCPFLWDGSLLSHKATVVNCHAEDGTPLVDFGGPEYEQHAARARAEIFAERLRLAYVALTRARSALWVHVGPVQQGPSYTSAEGFHSSALAWLLLGHQLNAEAQAQGPEQVLELLQQGVQGQPQTLIKHSLEQLVERAAGSMQVLPLLQQGTEQAATLLRAEAPAPLRHLQRSLHSAWRMGSFSALTAGQHKEAPDHDQQSLPAVQDPGQGFYAFPRGARAGVCLHAIFEDWARDAAPLSEAVQTRLTEHGIDPEQWAEIAGTHLQQVLDTPLDGEQLRLAALTRRLPELGFTFPVARLDVARLRAILLDPRYDLAPAMRTAAEHLQFETLSGFMKGFIDLTFEYQGRWYILDYKSNWLGSQAQDYRVERLEQAIAAEHYYLQYLIYLIALRRFLRQRLGEAFSDQQIGGAYYLFIRGMPQAGVYFQRPATQLLDALDHLFQEAGQ